MQTHHKHSLHPADAFAEDGAQLIPDSRQEEAEERNAEQRVDDAEDPSTFRVRRNVAKTCRRTRRIQSKMMLSRHNRAEYFQQPFASTLSFNSKPKTPQP